MFTSEQDLLSRVSYHVDDCDVAFLNVHNRLALAVLIQAMRIVDEGLLPGNPRRDQLVAAIGEARQISARLRELIVAIAVEVAEFAPVQPETLTDDNTPF